MQLLVNSKIYIKFFFLILIKSNKQVNTTNPFNKWVRLGLRNLDPFNKHVGLVLTYVVNTHDLTRHESDTQTRIATPNPMGTGSSKPSIKRRLPSKGDRAPKKPKVSLEPVVGLMAEGAKMVTPTKHGAGKGLMIPSPGSQKKPPVLLREDPNYALEKLSSIISSGDYEDLGNHSTEAIGETGLFSIAQVNIHRFLAHLYSLFEINFPTLFRPCS